MTLGSLRIAAAAHDIFAYQGDALILPLLEGGEPLRGAVKTLTPR